MLRAAAQRLTDAQHLGEPFGRRELLASGREERADAAGDAQDEPPPVIGNLHGGPPR